MGKQESQKKDERYGGDSCEDTRTSPGQTMTDFRCSICDAHMNSEEMWESHISGKRHLKNIKKNPRGPPPPRQQQDHGSRRRRSFSSSEGQHERRYSPDADYKSSRLNRSKSPNGHSSTNGRWRHNGDYSADARSPSPVDVNRWRSYRDLSNLEWSQKISLLKELSSGLEIVNDEEFFQIQNIIQEVSRSLLQYSIRQLPEEEQNALARKVARDFSDQECCPTVSQGIQATQGINSPRRRHRPFSSRRHHRSSRSRRHHRSSRS